MREKCCGVSFEFIIIVVIAILIGSRVRVVV